MRNLTAFAVGQPDTKIVNGVSNLVTPIAWKSDTEMGVGLKYDSGRADCWGLVMPERVLTSYRGMQIAGLVKEFENRTLCGCWYSGSRDVRPSDKQRVDEIEAKIGKAARERIITTLPKDFNAFMAELSAKGVEIPAWEIEAEIKDGILKVTPTIQAYLDKCSKEAEQLKLKEYGVLIPTEQARMFMSYIASNLKIGDFSLAFVQAFEKFADSKTTIAIEHIDFFGLDNFLIAKMKEDDNIEMTLKGSYFLTGEPFLQIGMQYGGRNTEFTPKVPSSPVQAKPQGKLEKILGWFRKSQSAPASTIEESKFPVGSTEYGAKLWLDWESVVMNSYNHTQTKPSDVLGLEVKDNRLQPLARSVYDAVVAGVKVPEQINPKSA